MNRRTAVFLLSLAAAAPAEAFYCGHDLVMEGDYMLQVLQKCGEPTYHQSRVEFRNTLIRGSGIQQPGLDIIQQGQLIIDEWIYDFGPQRVMKGLYFENGRLISVKELGYGQR